MIKQTSRNALAIAEASGKAGLQRYLILRYMVKHPNKRGRSRSELSQRLDMPINVICGRVFDLLKAGVIEVMDEKKICLVTRSEVEALNVVS